MIRIFVSSLKSAVTLPVRRQCVFEQVECQHRSHPMTSSKSIGLMLLVVALFTAVPLLAVGETATIQSPPNDISHFVKFEIGGSQLPGGDRITIDEIHGTADTIAV